MEDHPYLLESRSSMMRTLLEAARRAAGSDATILLTGESGTGKDVLARQIHEWSPRHDGPFVVIDCTTLAEQLLQDELFGHLRGGFTGAVTDKPGRLELSEGGTIYFSQIADLPPSFQAKLLRFADEQSFERIGDNRTISVNARIIAALNDDIEAQLATGRVRADLYHRLSVITFRLPPLRERMQDILLLAESILRQLTPKTAHGGLTLSPEAAELLSAYRWPGNIRELHNALSRAAVLARTDTITIDDLPESIIYGPRVSRFHADGLEAMEREHISRVLAESPTFEQAAAKLGVNVTTLWRKRKRYGIG